ncbi:MAG: hypothetical protein KDF58_11475 [Alphaproteobacteria bacterium]|nr:hypothetical protein [Alphaproteobacteria bacterium]HPF46555.1 hypothetical protein [Emcibacteraceae bacterium]
MFHFSKKNFIKISTILTILSLPLHAYAADKKIIAKRYFSNFPLAKGNYNGISSASDGLIYYVLCSGDLDTGAQMYSYNPKSDKITHLADLTEIVGEKGQKSIPQGKSHVNYYEYKGKLYFATHIDFYTHVDGKEILGIPPEGYKPYPGGHIVSYDMTSGNFEDLGIASKTKGGVLAQTMDRTRGRLYGIIWPSGEVYRYDVESRDLKTLGKFFADGEEGNGDRYLVLSRSLTVDETTGNVFFANPLGEIYQYILAKDEIEKVTSENLVKDYFGHLDVHRSMGYQWRQSIWSDYDKMIYGVHLESEYLFRLNPKTGKIEFLDRLASPTTKRAGVTGYGGSLGLTFGENNHTLYHISHAYPSEEDFKQFGSDAVSKLGLKNHHLISYDLKDHKYSDLGEITFEDGSEPVHINSLAYGADGNFYAVTTIELQVGNIASDLISFPNPNVTQ